MTSALHLIAIFFVISLELADFASAKPISSKYSHSIAPDIYEVCRADSPACSFCSYSYQTVQKKQLLTIITAALFPQSYVVSLKQIKGYAI